MVAALSPLLSLPASALLQLPSLLSRLELPVRVVLSDLSVACPDQPADIVALAGPCDVLHLVQAMGCQGPTDQLIAVRDGVAHAVISPRDGSPAAFRRALFLLGRPAY